LDMSEMPHLHSPLCSKKILWFVVGLLFVLFIHCCPNQSGNCALAMWDYCILFAVWTLIQRCMFLTKMHVACISCSSPT
jgi:hypothetical protein